MSQNTEKRYVYVAKTGWRFLVERYELLKETDSSVIVLDRGNRTVIRKTSHGVRVFLAEAEAREHMRAYASDKVHRLETDLAERRQRAASPCRIAAIDSKPQVFNGQIRLD